VAKGYQRGNREKKKPKADKAAKPAAQTSPFARRPGMGIVKSGAAKKGR